VKQRSTAKLEVKYMSTRTKRQTGKRVEYIENWRKLIANTADPNATGVSLQEIGRTAFDNETVH
jgi:hypothetical protein